MASHLTDIAAIKGLGPQTKTVLASQGSGKISVTNP
jgi:hypothetical protein